MPDLYSLCEDPDTDELRPIPTEWLVPVTPRSSSTLPDIEGLDISFEEDVWRELDSSDDEREVQSALELEESIRAAHLDMSLRSRQLNALDAMSVVVEVPSETERPSGSHEQFTTSQKQKYVPRTARQHDFHSRFASGRGVQYGSQRPERSETGHNSRNNGTSKPSYFHRESCQVPGGGWFNTSTATGGGSPPSSDPGAVRLRQRDRNT